MIQNKKINPCTMYIQNIKNFVQLLLSSCIHCNINSDETKNPHYPFSSKVNRAWFWGFGGGWLFSLTFPFLGPGGWFIFLKYHLLLHITNKAIKSLRQEALSSSLDIAPGVQVT